MATVKIFPTGPTWDTWDTYRAQARLVDFDTLAAAYPPDQWLTLDTITDWPGVGFTNVESDIPGAEGNTVILTPFETVAPTTAAAGLPTTPIHWGWILAGFAGLALILWSRK